VRAIARGTLEARGEMRPCGPVQTTTHADGSQTTTEAQQRIDARLAVQEIGSGHIPQRPATVKQGR
jgi:hypothetical protein